MKTQNRVITTPRGTNLGRNIKNDLINAFLYGNIEVIGMDHTRDTVNKSIVTNIEYRFV